MQMLDLSPMKIRQILIKAGMNKKLVNNMLMGRFTPITYSKPRFKSKIEDVKGMAKHLTEKSDNWIYNVDRNFVFPQFDLNRVKMRWSSKRFFPETYNEKTKKWEGGYKPELEGAITNDKGNVVYDENGKIKKEPTILQKGWEKIKPYVTPLSGQVGQAPLPPTPGVSPQLMTQGPQNISQTGLTHTENALLSNEEKAMRLRQRGLS